jgi:hypothetical protein
MGLGLLLLGVPFYLRRPDRGHGDSLTANTPKVF